MHPSALLSMNPKFHSQAGQGQDKCFAPLTCLAMELFRFHTKREKVVIKFLSKGKSMQNTNYDNRQHSFEQWLRHETPVRMDKQVSLEKDKNAYKVLEVHWMWEAFCAGFRMATPPDLMTQWREAYEEFRKENKNHTQMLKNHHFEIINTYAPDYFDILKNLAESDDVIVIKDVLNGKMMWYFEKWSEEEIFSSFETWLKGREDSSKPYDYTRIGSSYRSIQIQALFEAYTQGRQDCELDNQNIEN